MRGFFTRRVTLFLAAVLALLLTGGSAWAAFQQLPPGGQVNNDVAAGIEPANGVAIQDPADADVTGGSLNGGLEGPWAVFRSHTSGGGKDQVFARSFAGGTWTTRGHGTVGGRSDAVRQFSGSLNFDQGQDAQAPSTDFAGSGRKIPWATWSENTTGLNTDNIFASKYDAASDRWYFAGQGRGTGGGTTQVPSLNIHTDRDAENPSIAGGSTTAGADPLPWVTWQEVDGGASGPTQIFTSKAVASPGGTCSGKPVGASGAVNGFCWQQVGNDRLSASSTTSSATGDPSMNVDPTRDALEPDIAFAGPSDTVPWVVWYEVSSSGLGLHGNAMVFAAKGTTSAGADGQVQWTAVGTAGTGTLDATGTHGFGACAESSTAEAGCAVNANASADAVDPRVAAGTMTPGSPTVPWIVWEETSGGHERIFVSRLVGSGTAARFVVANNGMPLPTATAAIDASRPDITFSGNTPYVSWHEGGSDVHGHFTSPDAFVIDGTAVGSSVPGGVRTPLSSTCTANPTNGDGQACQAGAIGTPFFLFTDGTVPTLFADGYQSDAPVVGAASGITNTAATVTATVNPQGAPVDVDFEYGPTTAYGSTTTPQHLGPANSPVSFTGALSALPAGSTIHCRAVALTDFGKVVGPDQTLVTSGAGRVTLKIVRTTLKKLLKSKKLSVVVTSTATGTENLTLTVKLKVRAHHRTRVRRITPVTRR